MRRVLFCLAMTGLGLAAAQAQDAQAQCQMFRRTPDGRWYSTITSKVGNARNYKVLKAGVPINPHMKIAGANVVATIERLCGSR